MRVEMPMGTIAIAEYLFPHFLILHYPVLTSGHSFSIPVFSVSLMCVLLRILFERHALSPSECC